MDRPDRSARPDRPTCERSMAGAPRALYPAWTTAAIERWFAAPGTASMRPEVGAP